MKDNWNDYEKQLVAKAYEEAHQAWLEEKEIVLDRAEELFNDFKTLYEEKKNTSHNMVETPYYVNSMYRIIKFIKNTKD